MNHPVVIDETTDITRAELFEQCKELKGIGGLIVGKTTLEQALADPECNLYERRNSFMPKGKWSIMNGNERKWVEQNYPEIRRYSCSGGFMSPNRYMIGDFGLDDMYAVFYNGVLAGVAYDCCNRELYDLIVQKYGKGVGEYHYFFQDNEPEINPNYRRRQKVLIDKYWENESVKMHYFFSLNQKMGGSHTYVSEEHYCIIWDKTLLPLFENRLQQALSEYQNSQKIELERTQSRI